MHTLQGLGMFGPGLKSFQPNPDWGIGTFYRSVSISVRFDGSGFTIRFAGSGSDGSGSTVRGSVPSLPEPAVILSYVTLIEDRGLMSLEINPAVNVEGRMLLDCDREEDLAALAALAQPLSCS